MVSSFLCSLIFANIQRLSLPLTPSSRPTELTTYIRNKALHIHFIVPAGLPAYGFYNQDISALTSRNVLYHDASIPSHKAPGTRLPDIKASFNSLASVAIKC